MRNTAFEELRKLSDEIENSSATRIENRILLLDAVFYIPMTNYDELQKKLRSVTSPDNLAMWEVNNRKELLMAQIEITRLLHNFLAAAFTLVNYTRGLNKDSPDESEFWQDHKKEIDRRFAKDPLHKFMQALRNYFLHRSVLFPAISFHGSRDEESGDLSTEISAYLDKEALLLEFNKEASSSSFSVDAIAKLYLDKMPEKVDLAKIIEDYYFGIESFHLWRKSRLQTMHDSELKWLDEKRHELENIQEMMD